MRSRTTIWFEAKIRYEKMMEDGCLKKVTETYVIDALSFGEAEKRILEEMGSYVSGKIDVCGLKIAPYKEIFFADSDMADRWYVAKLAFITIDEKTDKEKKQAVYFIVKASDINNAHTVVVQHMKTSFVDYEIATLDETKIMDIFRYKPNTANG